MNDFEDKVTLQTIKIRKDHAKTLNKERASSSIDVPIKHPNEDKLLLKKLVIKSIIFNFEKGQLEESIFELKKLINTFSKSSKEKMKTTLMELYICVLEYSSFNLKKCSSHLNSILNKLEFPDFSKESKLDEYDFSLFKKLICHQFSNTFRPLFKDEDLLIELIKSLENSKQILKGFLSKDNFRCFVLFIAACMFQKKGVKKMTETYSLQLKEKLEKNPLEETTKESKDMKSLLLTTINKTSANAGPNDEFLILLGKSLKIFGVDSIVLEKPKVRTLARVASSVSSTKNVLKPMNIFQASPRRNSTHNLASVKNSSSTQKVSDYHKYIKNTSNIRQGGAMFHSPNSKRSNNSFISSLGRTKNSFNLSKQRNTKTNNANLDGEDSTSTGVKQQSKSTLTNEHNSKKEQVKETLSGFESKKKSLDNLLSNINGTLKHFEKCIYEYSEQLLSSKKGFKELNY